jgi:co-chaperonin GroES (HSP10)
MGKVKGKIVPLRDMIIGSEMEFGMETTRSGIILHSDNGKTAGIHPRWCKVYAVGPKQKDVKVGQWICVEHGRWGRTVELETDNGPLEVRAIDPKCVLLVANHRPKDTAMRGV